MAERPLVVASPASELVRIERQTASKEPDDGERSAYVLLGFGMSEAMLERGRSSNND